jgi:Insertion element 4 transposase N-terminal/Transposase DDE domain
MARTQAPVTRALGPLDLQRLAALQQFIGSQRPQQVLQDTGRRNRRHCRLTHLVMLWLVLAMTLFADLPLREVFRVATRRRRGDKLPGRPALCRARQRLGVAPVRRLFYQVAQPLARPQRPGGFYRGLRLVGIDSTLYDVPDSPANARIFGRPSGGRGDGAFPQVRKLSLVELGTHAELAMVLKPCTCSEQAMFPGLVRHLQPGLLLLCDQNFFSFGRWQQLRARGVELLWRVQSQMVLEPEQELADGSYLARVYPSPKHRLRREGGLVVRVIRYTLDDPQRVGHGQVHTLLTTLLDSEAHPATTLILLYHERWEHELVYDEQKTHQAPRQPAKEAQVRSETPAGVVQELYALALGHYVTRALMAEAAASEKLDPDRLSFLNCLRILRLRLRECPVPVPECPSRSWEEFRAWYEDLLLEMAEEQLPARRNRINPRVVKRKLSKFPKKRAAHRPVPPLTKKFVETIVIQT